MYVLLSLFALWFVYRLIKTKGGTVSDSLPSKARGRPYDSTYLWPKLNEYDFVVVGESHFQSSLAQIASKYGSSTAQQECFAHLIPEDDNEFDNKAIKVAVDGLTVGYMDRENARSFRQRLGKKGWAGQTTYCQALVVGGGNLPNGETRLYGIQLDLKCFD